MRGYVAFVKKEILESVRTYKLLIVIATFFILGMMSPLMAKLLPELLKNMALDGMTITFTEPTAIDAYSQFFKNLTQIGLIVLILVFSGIMSNEFAKGTLINVLTKGLSRHAVVLAKCSVYLGLWTLGLTVAFLTTYGYTEYLFSHEGIDHLILSVFCLWLFGAFLLSVFMQSATLIKSSYGSLLMSVLVVGLLFTVNIAPNLQKFNPLTLVTNNVAMLSKNFDLSAIYTSIVITIPLTVLFIVGSLLIFKKQSI